MEILQLKPEQVTRPILKLLNQLGNTDKLTLSDARRIVEQQTSKNHLTYVLYQDGVPLGIGSLLIKDCLIRNGNKSAFIEDVCIKKDCHGKGYGRMLIGHLKKIAAREGCYKVMLTCSEKKIGFYQKMGFRPQDYNMRIDI